MFLSWLLAKHSTIQPTKPDFSLAVAQYRHQAPPYVKYFLHLPPSAAVSYINHIFFYFRRGMRLAVFFISLFYTLLGGNGSLLAAGRTHGSHHSTSQHLKQASAINFSSTTRGYTFTTTSGFPAQDQLLICEEVEDEDANSLSQKKCKPVVSIHSLPSYPSIFTFHEQRVKAVPFYWRPISARYILLRSLRIWFPALFSSPQLILQ